MTTVNENKQENLIKSIVQGILKKCASYTFFVIIITIIVGIMSADFMDNHKIIATSIIGILIVLVFVSDYFFDI